MSEFYNSNVALITDPERVIEVKILQALNGGAGGGGGGGGTGGGLSGSGSPQGSVTASPGQTYLDTATNDFWAKATGTGTNTGWVELIAG